MFEDPKGGDLWLSTLKSGENQMEEERISDVQIDFVT